MINNINLIKYLEEKNIFIIKNKSISNKMDSKIDIFKQIDNIIYFNTVIGKYKENLMPRIKGNIFKEYEEYKKQIMVLEKYLRDLDRNNLNKIDEYIINTNKELIETSGDALRVIEESNINKLIKRSMINYEVCLDRVDENNLVVDKEGRILIGNIRYLSYNLKEHDIYSLIKKIKRKNINISLEEIIDYYLYKESLDEDSKKYLYGFSIYPNEEMKIIQRYIRKKILLNEEETIEALKIAKEIDKKII